MSKKNKQEKKGAIQKKISEPISSRIAKAVYDSKRISERIFGYIKYDIKFIKAIYYGKTQRPAMITAIEKGIVGILLVDESASFDRIGTILGLDVVNDKAECSILQNALTTLKNFNAIEGDNSCLALTEAGRAYADKGERPDSYIKTFDLFIDINHPNWLNLKNGIGDNIKKIDEINTPCENLNLTLEQVKAYAEYQAQDVHCPQNRYLLESADWHEGHEASYAVYVCFVQNVGNSDDVRAFVFDENIDGLNDLIAQYINSNDQLKTELLTNCILLECENDEETRVLEGDEIVMAKSEIPEELKKAEQIIIKEEEGEDLEEDINTESISLDKDVTKSNIISKDRLRKKALYDSLSFEVELQKIFCEDNPDEVWLISPWIRKLAFIQDRGPMVETFLKDESKRVFIAYSEPAVNNDGRPMMDEEVEPGIKLLEEQYPNFYYVQLPEFHLKNVIEVKGDQRILFSGSFNVLSFSVSEKQTHVRREEMALAHHTVAKKKYADFQFEFAKIYSERILSEIEHIDCNNIEKYSNDRLDYFLSIDNVKIKEIFSPIEDLLEEKRISSIKETIRKQLIQIGQELVLASNTSGLNVKEKKTYTEKLAKISQVIDSNSIVDPSMSELLNDDRSLLLKVHEKKIFPRGKGIKDIKPRSTHPILPNNTVVNKEGKDRVLSNAPEDNTDSLALSIAKLSFSFINRKIGKTALNAKLISVVVNNDLVNLLDVILVTTSRNNENAFDLSLGVEGYMFRFPTLFNKRELFDAVQKKSTKTLTYVNQENIETVVNKLL